jgi:hypothetical protein
MVDLDFGRHGKFLLVGTVASGSPFALLRFRPTGGGSEQQVGIDLDKRLLLGAPPLDLDPRQVEDIAAKMNLERLRLVSARMAV